MASTKLSDISQALSILYATDLQTQILSNATLLYLLPWTLGGGQALYWTAEFSGAADAVASAEGVQRDASDADAELEVPATLPWAQYDKTSSVTGLAEAAAGSNYNPASAGALNGSVLMGKVQRQCRRLGLGLARDLYIGDPGATPFEIAGASLAIDSSGTFASINPATYPEWSAAENSTPKVGLSFSKVRKLLFTPIYRACGEEPEFCTVSPELFDDLKDLFGDNELAMVQTLRVSSGGGPNGDQPRTINALDAGLKMVSIDGVTFVKDVACPADTIFAWHTGYVEIKQLPPPMNEVIRSGMSGVTELFRAAFADPLLVPAREDIEGLAARNAGPQPHVKFLGARGDSTEAMVLIYIQTCWKRRNAFGKLVLT